MADIHRKVVQDIKDCWREHGAIMTFNEGTPEFRAAMDLVRSGKLVKTDVGANWTGAPGGVTSYAGRWGAFKIRK